MAMLYKHFVTLENSSVTVNFKLFKILALFKLNFYMEVITVVPHPHPLADSFLVHWLWATKTFAPVDFFFSSLGSV